MGWYYAQDRDKHPGDHRTGSLHSRWTIRLPGRPRVRQHIKLRQQLILVRQQGFTLRPQTTFPNPLDPHSYGTFKLKSPGPQTEVCLLTSAPPGYTPPSFPKYNGTGNPKAHLLQQRATEDPLLIRLFQRSLTYLEWFISLEPGSIKTFAELANRFIHRSFRTSISTISWKTPAKDLTSPLRHSSEGGVPGMASRVSPPKKEKEQFDMILANTVKPLSGYIEIGQYTGTIYTQKAYAC